jgi:hypothetical protein
MAESMSGHYRILSPAEIDVLGEQVFYDDELGLGWEEIEVLPGEIPLGRINARNETVLRSITMLEERDETQVENAERAEFNRLEGKVDLLLELLAQMVRNGESPARAHSLRLNARGLCWNTAVAPPADALLCIELYPLPAWPLHLTLYARVTDMAQRHRDWRVCARIEALSVGAKEWLDKLVFRRHRRAVAMSRSAR